MDVKTKRAAAAAVKKLEKRVYAQINPIIAGVPIPIMEVPKIFKVGMDVAKTNGSDDEIASAVRTYVDHVKV